MGDHHDQRPGSRWVEEDHLDQDERQVQDIPDPGQVLVGILVGAGARIQGQGEDRQTDILEGLHRLDIPEEEARLLVRRVEALPYLAVASGLHDRLALEAAQTLPAWAGLAEAAAPS